MALTSRSALVALVGAAVVVLAPSWPVVAAVLAAWALLVAADLALAGDPRMLAFDRSGARSVRLGETAEVTLAVVNGGRRPVRGVLRDAWPPSAGALHPRHRLAVPAGERRHLTTQLRPTRRGDRWAARVTVRSVGPLGLAARQRSRRVPWVVRALPPFASRKHLPAKLARLRELDGRATVLQRGQGTEFDVLREYVAGDDVRSIDWRASARAGDVVVRTWRPERDRHVLVVLDTGRTSAARVGDAPRLDAALDAALLLAALASRAGDCVDLLAYDRAVRARVEGAGRAGGADLLASLVAAMAPLEPELIEADMPGLVSQVLAMAARRSLVVLVTGLDAPAIEEGLLPVLPALTRRHQLVIAAVADPALAALAAGRGDAEAVYGAAAAARAMLERRHVTDLLRRRGVEVVDEPPDTLAPALADRYLALKAAGRL